MFKSFNRDQEFFLPPSLRDLIPDDDLVYLILEVVSVLDLKPLYKKYDSLGQNGYHPAMLLSVLFYSYSKGVFSSRKIAEQLKESVRFMYLSGMQTPDFRTISDFRKNNIDLLKQYFVEIVHICQQAGIATVNSVSIDGTKMLANASSKRSKSSDAIAEQLEKVQQQINQLMRAAEDADRADEQHDTSDGDSTLLDTQLTDLKELHAKLQDAKDQLDQSKNQTHINLTDPDCRNMKGLGPCYNSQLAVDNEHQIILGAKVVSENNDVHQLLPMIEEVEANTESKGHPKQVFSDCGYASAAAYKELEKSPHIDAYVPTREQVHHRRRPVSPFHKSRFELNTDRLTCRCPLGHSMRIIRRGTNKSGEPYINFIGTECPSCSSRAQCTKARYRNVIMYLAEPIVQKMRQKMETDAGRQAMRVRRQTVEPVFGILKEQLGFRRFHLRGLPKVNGEFALLCSAFNIRKLHGFLGDRPLAGVLSQIRESASVFCAFGRFLLRFLPFRQLLYAAAR